MHQSLGIRVPRATFAAASLATTALLLLAVIAAFHLASSVPWLRDTPMARQAVARCETLPSRSAQRECLQAVAVAARERDAGSRWQAAAASDAAAEPPARR